MTKTPASAPKPHTGVGTPTVTRGRVVFVHTPDSFNVPSVGVVTNVLPNEDKRERVSLALFGPDGDYRGGMPSVPHGDDNSDPASMWWTWPPRVAQ